MDRVEVRNRCRVERVSPAYGPVIAAAVAALTPLFAGRVQSIRLQGSIPRGDAVPPASDLDLMALLTAPATPADAECVEQTAGALADAFPIVSRVDIAAVDFRALTAFQRFVLATDSIVIHGNDDIGRDPQVLTRLDLARLVTPDLASLLQSYREWVADLSDDSDVAELAFVSRIVGKDVLKGYRAVVILEAGAYAVQPATIHRMVRALHPAYAATVDGLLAATRQTASPTALLVLINAATAELGDVVKHLGA